MSEEQRKEWEYFKEKVIPAYIDRLNGLEEEKSELDRKKKDIILELAERCEKFMSSDEIARFLVIQLKDVVSKRWVEEILGKRQKRSYDRYQDQQSAEPHISNNENNRTIEVSSAGKENYVQSSNQDKDIENERDFNKYQDQRHDSIAERSAEIAISTIDTLKEELAEKDARINEAFSLVQERDKRIHELQMQMGEIEVELGKLKKNPPPKSVDEKEELQIKYDELKVAYDELKQVETLRTQKEDFKPASQVLSGPRVWVAAINAINFYRELNKASKYAIEHNEPWKKLIFDIASDGQLKVARLEGA